MKKLLLSFIIFAAVASGLIYIMGQIDIDTLPNGTRVINSINKTQQVDLNTFLAYYKSGSLAKIKLVDSNKLE